MKILITEDQLNSIINEELSNEITAYHGSYSKINMFVTDFVGGEKAIDQEGPGIYFVTNKEEAMRYGTFLYTVKISPRKLLSNQNKRGVTRASMIKLIKMKEDWELDAYDWDENLNIGLQNSLADIFDHDNAKDIITQVYIDYYKYSPKEYVNNAAKLGYDGLIVSTDWNSQHIIIYNPAIVKIINIEDNSEK